MEMDKWTLEFRPEGYKVTVDRLIGLNSRDASAVVGVVNKLDRRRVLTTQSTCGGEIVQIQSLGQSSRLQREVPKCSLGY